MKVSKLYATNNFHNNYIIEDLNGKLYRFFITPIRKIMEKDLIPLADNYRLYGKNAEEAPEYLYRFYGLER